MLTLEGLVFVQKLITSQLLHIALFDKDGVECSFKGYDRLALTTDAWYVNEDGNFAHPPVVFALHEKKYLEVYMVKIVANGATIISDELVENPYTMRYKGDEIKVNVTLRMVRS